MKTSPAILVPILCAAGLSMIASPTSRASSIYVSNVNGQIEHFSAGGVDLGAFATTGLNGPRGLVFDASGNLYVANSGNGTIEKFSPSGVGTAFVSTGLNAVSGLAFDTSGDIYATNYGNNTISKFDLRGNLLSTFTSPTLNNPFGIAVDSHGNVFVSNFSGASITEFNSSGLDLGTFATTGLSHPIGLTFDASGNLYAANQSTNTIERFTPAGVGSLFANTGLSQPVGLTSDPSGSIYAANLGGGTIEKYNTLGTDLGTFATDGAGTPTFLTFDITAIPEPGATALVAPVVALGAILGRRRRRLINLRNDLPARQNGLR